MSRFHPKHPFVAGDRDGEKCPIAALPRAPSVKKYLDHSLGGLGTMRGEQHTAEDMRKPAQEQSEVVPGSGEHGRSARHLALEKVAVFREWLTVEGARFPSPPALGRGSGWVWLLTSAGGTASVIEIATLRA